MKDIFSNRAAILTIVLATFISVVGWAASGATPVNSTTDDFQIVVERTEDGIILSCEHGCAWKELSWKCDDSDESCKRGVDFNGTFMVEE